MKVLSEVHNIYVRASEWTKVQEARLKKVTLQDATLEESADTDSLASSVEECQCPAGYTGTSCEDCGDGYYRVSVPGMYKGTCEPCNCRGHASTCDKETGVCDNCVHFTEGDQCDRCIEGYFGDATQGTAYDCNVCPCPREVMSNNFATSCGPRSEEDATFVCDCKSGYTGDKCEMCAASFFGNPEVIGESCTPCQCNDNINVTDPMACDHKNGHCLICTNNAAGEACSECAPGFFGDAITDKSCRTCGCDECGTENCNHMNGECKCKPSVSGDKCDRCERDHYGFGTCRGCIPCECGEASDSLQCNDEAGQCRCRPGVTGRTCDHCESGFWNFKPTGCERCLCNPIYAEGVGCNPETGQCECLPGVIGQNCDRCPYRWVLITNKGCEECNTCQHDLLDASSLPALLGPVIEEFVNTSRSFFSQRRLDYFLERVEEYEDKINALQPPDVNFAPLQLAVRDLQEVHASIEQRTKLLQTSVNSNEKDLDSKFLRSPQRHQSDQ